MRTKLAGGTLVTRMVTLGADLGHFGDACSDPGGGNGQHGGSNSEDMIPWGASTEGLTYCLHWAQVRHCSGVSPQLYPPPFPHNPYFTMGVALPTHQKQFPAHRSIRSQAHLSVAKQQRIEVPSPSETTQSSVTTPDTCMGRG